MVMLRTDKEQFGPDGPKKGAEGYSYDLRKDSDGDIYLQVAFRDFEDLHWVSLDDLLYPDTSGSETFWRLVP